MSYIYADVDKLEGPSKVGTKQCVALLQHITKKGKHTSGTFVDPSNNANAYSVIE